MAEKSEKATPKKLRDARKKGQVAKAQDFPGAITFIVAVALTMYMLNFLYEKIGGFTLQIFQIAAVTDLTKTAPFFLRELINLILITSLPVAGAVAIVGILVGFLVVGPTFSVEVLKPDIKKFNVVENLKQKFKMKTFIELIKSVLKLFGAGLLIYLVARVHIKDLVITPTLPPLAGYLIFQSIIYKVVVIIGIYFLLIATADLLYQKYNFGKEMKMEKFEVKQEYKDTEGNPEIKGKRRQLAQEIAYDDGAGQVRRARTVITNPNDIACAIGYEPEKYKAPWIIEMGSGVRAAMIIRIAERYDIPIMRNVPLAHQLLDEGEVSKFIPESTYEAIGEILLFVESLRAREGKRGEEEE